LTEVCRRRRHLDQIIGLPRAAQRDGALAEECVDVARQVRLARSALVLLLDQPDDGRILLGQLRL
jgi:hypothetical protein